MKIVLYIILLKIILVALAAGIYYLSQTDFSAVSENVSNALDSVTVQIQDTVNGVYEDIEEMLD
ncbi:MAG: hypothetical protein LUD27_02945 [Clostridia bacterium]|nr:hypothetical protein [Clostridia bacterium]